MEIQKLIGKVCDRSWGLKEADVVCKQLGCGSALKTSYQVYSKIQATNTWLFLSNCNGNETSIWDCKNWQWGGLSCEHYDEAKVTCSGMRPHGLYSSWNYSGQNTGVCSLSLLQRIFPTQGLNPGLPHCRHILYHMENLKAVVS